MIAFKKISCLIFAFCVLQWPLSGVNSAAVTAAASNKKSAYARTDDKGQEVSSSILGSLYHKSRQSRCVTCFEDRRGDDRGRYYGTYAARSGDDRASSWYYSGYDRYDDRGYRGGEYDRYGSADRYGSDRYGSDRYGSDRYGDKYGSDKYGGSADRYGGYRDDRYGSRPSYDRYDTRSRAPGAYDRGESRGYGYDNRDRYEGERGGASDYYGRDRYYERPRYGAGASSGYGSYDRDSYDRYLPRYDFRQYRPRDDAYRGQSSYDSTGRGYYGKGTQEDRHYLPEPGYNSPAISPCGARKPNCPYNNNQDEGTRVSSGTINSDHYGGVSQTTYPTNSNNNNNQNENGQGSSSSSPSSSSSSGWSYMREDEQNSRGGSNSGSNTSNSSSNNNSNRDRTRDQQSPAYGALLDRGSNLIAVEPVKANDTNNESSNDQQTNANGEGTQSDNGQNA